MLSHSAVSRFGKLPRFTGRFGFVKTVVWTIGTIEWVNCPNHRLDKPKATRESWQLAKAADSPSHRPVVPDRKVVWKEASTVFVCAHGAFQARSVYEYFPNHRVPTLVGGVW